MASFNETKLRKRALECFEEILGPVERTGRDDVNGLISVFGNKNWQGFMYKLDERFRLDFSGKGTGVKITDAIIAWSKTDLEKFPFYTRCCLLLIGHVDLFQHFERCMFNFEGGREETRREIESWRVDVRQKVVRELDVRVGLYRSTIAVMKDDGPEDLSPVQRELIERDCSLYLDHAAGTRWERNPRLDYAIVVPCLERKQMKFLAMYNYVLAYFEDVLSNTLH